jgi:NAD(P)-dependent dehydrogenase (short-subunit alcohol dehydrogenase family)
MNPRTFGLIGGAALVAHQVWKRARLFDLRGRTVLISGGARGLGYLLAQEFGRLGARVVIFSRSLDELARAREALEARGIDALDLTCDVRNPDQVARLVSQVIQHTGRLDVIVNNAGIIQATTRRCRISSASAAGSSTSRRSAAAWGCPTSRPIARGSLP